MKQYFSFLRTAEIAAYTRIEDGEGAYNEDINALVPEWWALEGLMVLEETLVVANLVNRDYNNYFVNAGDTVNINRPGTFEAKHKQRGVDTTIQDANTTPDTVKLNQHVEVTFALDDREMQRSAVELRSYFLLPAIRAIAEGVDGAIVGEGVQFAENAVGQLGVALDDDTLIDLGKTFDDNLCPAYNRYLVVGPSAKADLLRIDRFADADKSGRASALLVGQIGYAMGFDIFMSQTVGRQLVAWAGSESATLTVGSSALARGTTTFTPSADPTTVAPAGSWITIDGVPGIYQVSASSTGPDSITLSWGLKSGVDASAAITTYQPDDVVDANTAAGAIEVIIGDDGALPLVGQGVSFGTATDVYTITKVEADTPTATQTTITLNRPLDSAISLGDNVNLMPTGGAYNLAFRPDAITLVNRPLTPASAGVVATVQNNGSIALRVTIGYDQRKMMHAITVDTLLGVKVLDANQGAIVLN